MTLFQGSCPAARNLLPVILVFSFLTGVGCDSPGTGTVKVQDRSKIRKLNEGEGPTRKVGKVVEEQPGIKLRKKN